MRTSFCTLILAGALAVVPARAMAQHEHDHDRTVPEHLGRVHLPTSCRPEVQQGFERSLALLHSFAYSEAAKAFAEVAGKDPGCAMAQWGIAMSCFHEI